MGLLQFLKVYFFYETGNVLSKKSPSGRNCVFFCHSACWVGVAGPAKSPISSLFRARSTAVPLTQPHRASKAQRPHKSPQQFKVKLAWPEEFFLEICTYSPAKRDSLTMTRKYDNVAQLLAPAKGFDLWASLFLPFRKKNCLFLKFVVYLECVWYSVEHLVKRS